MGKHQKTTFSSLQRRISSEASRKRMILILERTSTMAMKRMRRKKLTHSKIMGQGISTLVNTSLLMEITLIWWTSLPRKFQTKAVAHRVPTLQPLSKTTSYLILKCKAVCSMTCSSVEAPQLLLLIFSLLLLHHSTSPQTLAKLNNNNNSCNISSNKISSILTRWLQLIVCLISISLSSHHQG